MHGATPEMKTAAPGRVRRRFYFGNSDGRKGVSERVILLGRGHRRFARGAVNLGAHEAEIGKHGV